MTKLIIARHGNTFDAGEVVRRVGITDLPLSKSGTCQAQKLAQYFLTNNLRPDIIFTSQLQRTKQMADILCEAAGENIDRQELAIFNEIDYGIDENKPETQVQMRLGDTLKLWEKQAIPPQEWNINPSEVINSWRNFAAMILDKYTNKTVSVFTSNGIARFAPYLTGDFKAFQAKHDIKLATAAFGIMQYERGNWVVKDWNQR
jgi:probable phosphoglycerate mutase